jgi:putative flavoprotein involved in K+ transport
LRTDVIVLGAGHAGLAMSRELSERSIEHLVIERGEVANSWKTERWDSLRLLTPNWQCRMPGRAYEGDAPDDFMRVPELVAFLERYAAHVAAPLRTHTRVLEVAPCEAGYRVQTDQGSFEARVVVLATGACNRASVPAWASELPRELVTITALDYRNPEQLPEGGVLVVGASATGVQLAHELRRSGRAVTLAVGEHVRLPRLYRGRDIQWWMDATGVLDMTIAEVDDLVRARRVPSPQLVGTPERMTLDLNALSGLGVELVGRLMGVREGKAQLSGSLRNVCTLADLKQQRLLEQIDAWARERGLEGELPPPERPDRTRLPESPPLSLDLRGGQVRSIVWATGYRPDLAWLAAPVFDHAGRIRHDGGVVAAPGLYLLGMPFLRRRKSSFIHGIADDVRELGEHLAAYLDALARR